MRLFLTTYQKSGTHQIMPALCIMANIQDKSHNLFLDMPDYTAHAKELDMSAVRECVGELRTFKETSFGHVSYLPQYAEALQAIPTRNIFNIRDPRDIVVAEYYNIFKNPKKIEMAWMNYYDTVEQKFVHQKDTIAELIKFAAARWPHWMGWLSEPHTKVIRYEDLRQNSEETLKGIAAWGAGCKLPNLETMMQRVHPRERNPTFRKGMVGEWKETFTDLHRQMSETLLKDIIKELGYEA